MIAIMSIAPAELFADLPTAAVTFDRGTFLFHEGDEVAVMHVIREGAVELRRYHADGTFVVMQRAGPLALLAEASLFARHYHCDAAAIAPVRASTVPVAAVLARLRADHAVAMAWARHLAHEVQEARLRAEIHALRSVEARLGAWLAWRGDLPPKGAWRCVAREIGISPEALYRALARRRKAEVVREASRQPARAGRANHRSQSP